MISNALKVASAVSLFAPFVFEVTQCTGPSMLPTLFSNDFVLVRHWGIRSGNLRHGDVITAVSPIDPHMYVSKRIIGMVSFILFIDYIIRIFSLVMLFVLIRQSVILITFECLMDTVGWPVIIHQIQRIHGSMVLYRWL